MSIMIDEHGLVFESGSSDKADSSRLAGLLAVFNHNKAPDLRRYFLNYPQNPVRHPFANTFPENEPRHMSRDQLTCLFSGMKVQGHKIDWDHSRYFAPNNMDHVTKKWCIPDFLSPSVRNHYRLCSGLEGSRLGFEWLKLDIKYNSWRLQRWADGKEKFPVEQNQLICQVIIATEFTMINWVEEYAKSTEHWIAALTDYWLPWREPDGILLKMIIDKIEGYYYK